MKRKEEAKEGWREHDAPRPPEKSDEVGRGRTEAWIFHSTEHEGIKTGRMIMRGNGERKCKEKQIIKIVHFLKLPRGLS